MHIGIFLVSRPPKDIKNGSCQKRCAYTEFIDFTIEYIYVSSPHEISLMTCGRRFNVLIIDKLIFNFDCRMVFECLIPCASMAPGLYGILNTETRYIDWNTRILNHGMF